MPDFVARADALAWPVRTARLALRPVTADDCEAVWRYRSRDDVRTYLGRYPAGRAEFRAWLTARHDPAAGRLSCVACEGDEIVGDLTLTTREAPSVAPVPSGLREGSLGYVIDPARTGRGLATEAALALVRLGFEQLGLRRITAEVFAEHAASMRVMRKLGFREEGVSIRNVLSARGTWFDDAHFALLAEEWTTRAS